MAEWNPLAQNATKLTSSLTGRDFLIPASGDVFNKGAQMSTEKLSTARRLIIGADGAIGTFSMFVGGADGLFLDLGLNAGGDYLDNYQKRISTNGQRGFFLKQTVMTVQTVISVHKSPANALSTFGMWGVSSTGNILGEADKTAKTIDEENKQK
ncbi:MAG: hypothetical protein EOO20_20185 [Chryseobacterium sp.]|nr:MAG: hypothetical protein EOO20_20185 [Chryseobacterium sp.]